MKIAFLGSRGIPRCYSGFETFVEEVSTRLVTRGHDVTVYNRVPFNTYAPDTFQGVRLRKVPTLQAKGTDTLVHSALCTIDAIAAGSEIVYYCGVGSAIFSLPAKLRGASTVVNVDGADWERAKWGWLGRTWLRWSEAMAARLADSVVADHPVIRDRYKRQFGIDCDLISYGADVVETDPGRSTLEAFGLVPGGYILYVSRLTPENRADVVMKAHLASGVSLPLVVVGDAPYVNDYVTGLRALAAESGGRIRMTGYQFGSAYRELSFHAAAFVFPTSIDATRPVLLEQMGMGACVVACRTPANAHVLGDGALWFENTDPVASLAAVLRGLETDPAGAATVRETARARIRSHYSWDRVADQYDELFATLRAGRQKTR